MAVKLKKLSEQVIVITGATSGIGLTTARKAAGQGARLVLAARDGPALERLTAEPCDVGNPEAVARVAQSAVARFGRIDTWVNNAGVTIFGRLDEVALEDFHRLFQTNFWGVVHGSLEAVKHMRREGGALINIGSEASDHAMPLQGMYAAAKHAVKGFTDALRMELEHDGAPISVTLVKPAAIDTMYTVHARNYMDVEPTLPAPVYAPDLVANAILYAAQNPKRDVFVGAVAKANSAGAHYLPRAMDSYLGKMGYRQQRSGRPAAPGRADALYASDPGTELRERLGHDGRVAESCPYTAASLRSKQVTWALLGGGALLAGWKYANRAGR